MAPGSLHVRKQPRKLRLSRLQTVPVPPMRLKLLPHVFFFVLLLLVTVAFLGLIRDFFQPLFWAAVLGVLFSPVFRRWNVKVNGRRSLASVLTVLTILLIVILPLFLVSLAVSHEAMNFYERIASGEINVQEPIRMAQEALPVATEFLERFDIDLERVQQSLSGAAVTVSRFLASQALAFGQNALRITGLFFVMIYLLFFFLRDGAQLVDGFIRVLPLDDARQRRLFGKFAEVSRATIKGTLVVGVVQGTIGGLMFWILGITAPVFWGVIMTLLSLLPAVGSALVWVPAALILMLTGQVAKGIILIVVGTLIIGLVDNILRPILVGRDTKMPDYLILLSTLGGLTVFGLTGFLIGPIIAALFLVLWQMFEEEYSGPENEAAVKEAFRHPETIPPPQPRSADAAEKWAVEGPPASSSPPPIPEPVPPDRSAPVRPDREVKGEKPQGEKPVRRKPGKPSPPGAS